MIDINVKINNKNYSLKVEPMRRLIDILREDLKITGSKEGCGEGECGACSVIMNNTLTLACLTIASQIDNAEILTVEQIVKEAPYIEKSFIESGAVQCGFCTPGFIVSTYNYIKNGGDKNEENIKHHLSGNFCRCTGYAKIILGVQNAIDYKTGAK